MMWSQCRWDMNTLNSPGVPFSSRSASPAAGRAPEPMSSSTRPAPSDFNSTHDELPPNVCVSANGRLSANAAAFSGVERSWPEARVSAAISFSRTERAVSAAGIEPRVPQNRTCMSGLCFYRGNRFVDARVAWQHLVEAADLEDLVHQRL